MAAKHRKPRSASPDGQWFDDLQQALKCLPELLYAHNLTIEDVWAKEHVSSRHELIHVRHGTAQIKAAGRIIKLLPDDTMLVPKGRAHSDLRISPGEYQVLMIVFQWNTADELLSGLDVQRLIRLPSQAKLHFRLLCQEVERESLQDAADAQQRASAALAELMTACVRYCQPVPRPEPQASRRVANRRRKKQMHAVRDYLQEHYDENVSLDQLAEMHGMNAFYLSRAFTQEFGASITDTLAGVRMQRARELLEAAELSVKQIAFRVGYANGNYFSKAFRRYYGLSPSEFQEKGLT